MKQNRVWQANGRRRQWQRKAQKKGKSQAQKIKLRLSFLVNLGMQATITSSSVNESIFAFFYLLVCHLSSFPLLFLVFYNLFSSFNNRIKGFFERAGKAKLKNGFHIVSV